MFKIIKEMTVYDVNCHSTLEKLILICKKINELIKSMNELNEDKLIMHFDCSTGDLDIRQAKYHDREVYPNDEETWECEY